MGINIFGSSGFAKEVYCICQRLGYKIDNFIDDSDISEKRFLCGIPLINEHNCNYNSPAIVAVGTPIIREKIVNKILDINRKTSFVTLIDPCARILSDTVKMGTGCIICAGVVITCDVTLCDFVHVNLNSTIGHDCHINDYNTFSPLVGISGHVKTGKRVYFGTTSSCHEKVDIVDDVIIGMGSVVIKNIKEKGTYIGVPTRKIK